MRRSLYWLGFALLVLLAAIAARPRPPIQLEAGRGPLLEGNPSITLDLRPVVRRRVNFVHCKDSDEASNTGVLEFGTDAWFDAIPDSMKVVATERTKRVYISILTAREAGRIELTSLPGYAKPTAGAEFLKPAGSVRVLFSWNLCDSSGRRVPGGYYAVHADGVRDGVGAIRVAR